MKYFMCLLFLTGFVLHDFYVSIAEIDHNPKTKSFEIAIKVFANDIERVIEEKESVKLFIGEENENEKCGAYLSAYLMDHFKIEVDGALKELEYLGHEMEKHDAVWTYFEAFDIDKPNAVKITNTILVDQHQDQQNIVYFGKSKGRPQTLMFNRQNTSAQIEANQ